MQRIPLHRRGGIAAYTLVDDVDWERFKDIRWHPRSPLGYASAVIDGRIEYMHRLILGLGPGSDLECDHINRDPLDNRRCNLRAVTHAENMRNVHRRRNGGWEGKLTRVEPLNERDDRVLALANQGVGIRFIATEVGLSKSTVHRILAAYGVQSAAA